MRTAYGENRAKQRTACGENRAKQHSACGENHANNDKNDDHGETKNDYLPVIVVLGLPYSAQESTSRQKTFLSTCSPVTAVVVDWKQELLHRAKVGFYFGLWYALNIVYNSM